MMLWSRRSLLGALPAAAAAQSKGSRYVGPTRTIRKRAPEQAVMLGPGPQLFVDDWLVLSQDGLTRTTHSPKRLPGPVVSHELGVWQPFVTVLRDPASGRFRMWYDAYAKQPGIPEGNYIACAESGDGVRWTAPRLDIIGKTNLLVPALRGYGVSVVDDGPAFRDASRRYKMAWWGRKHADSDKDAGIFVAFSPDGIRWTPHEGNPVLPSYEDGDDPRQSIGAGDVVDVFFDPITGRYAMFVKTFALPEDGFAPAPKAGSHFRRLVSYSTSTDFVHWRTPCRVIVPEERDEGTLEFYAAGGPIARGGLLIACPRMLRDDLPADPEGPVEGIGYATLVTSRDGECWERHEGVFMNRSLDPEAFDHAMTWVGCQLIVGDELWIYYGGYKQGRKVNRYTERQIGLAKLRRDGWVSRDAFGGEPGRLITPLLRTSRPGALTVNGEAAGGEVRVQVRDRWRKVVPGFAYEDCAPLRGNGLAQPVSWKAGPVPAAEPFHLDFRLSGARLYGFEFA